MTIAVNDGGSIWVWRASDVRAIGRARCLNKNAEWINVYLFSPFPQNPRSASAHRTAGSHAARGGVLLPGVDASGVEVVFADEHAGDGNVFVHAD